MVITRLYHPNFTVGILETLGFKCCTLELPWQGNEQNISCIPEGVYKYRVAPSPSRGTDVIWIDGVQGRSAIQIHTGNYTKQIQGCCLVGDGIKDINRDGIMDVTNSGDTFKQLMRLIPPAGTIIFRGSSIESVDSIYRTRKP